MPAGGRLRSDHHLADARHQGHDLARPGKGRPAGGYVGRGQPGRPERARSDAPLDARLQAERVELPDQLDGRVCQGHRAGHREAARFRQYFRRQSLRGRSEAKHGGLGTGRARLYVAAVRGVGTGRQSGGQFDLPRGEGAQRSGDWARGRDDRVVDTAVLVWGRWSDWGRDPRSALDSRG
uniref:(northern house mosquito) hypothetical protein n=1 Tax=Culex pipiens TaxID=7175 RepID=A0A8D8JBV1_CULPI